MVLARNLTTPRGIRPRRRLLDRPRLDRHPNHFPNRRTSLLEIMIIVSLEKLRNWGSGDEDFNGGLRWFKVI